MARHKWFSKLSLLVVMTMLLAACGSEAPPTAVTSAPPAAPTATTAQAVSPTDTSAPASGGATATTAGGPTSSGGQVYVGFVPPALTSPFHVAMADGATARAKENGWKLDVQAPASEG